MSSSFSGFSEEDLKRIKSSDSKLENAQDISLSKVKKLDRIGMKPKKNTSPYKSPNLRSQMSEDFSEITGFEKCRLSFKTTPEVDIINNNLREKQVVKDSSSNNTSEMVLSDSGIATTEVLHAVEKKDIVTTPDIVRGVENYTANELVVQKIKLEELQIKQKLMEEQNKKRKEMLAKALADRTKQTEEEVLKLEKIKKELQVLDGQLSQDVAVIRKKIDQACLSYADAEKHYFKVEKEFLQAKITLQKEREKKELLTEHLSALITHNETRKAQKLETLMLELACVKKSFTQPNAETATECLNEIVNTINSNNDSDGEAVVIDGVDQRTGKFVELKK